jgi:hypothetical protein
VDDELQTVGECSAQQEEEGVWKATRCMSGEEFEHAVEEKFLGGQCASPKCGSRFDGDKEEVMYSQRMGRKHMQWGCCSEECVAFVLTHMKKLGSKDDAVERFRVLYELARKEHMAKKGNVVRQGEESKAGSRVGTSLAAGTRQVPIMKAVVEERGHNNSNGSTKMGKDGATYDASAVEGYVLKNPAGKKKVHFADEQHVTQDIMKNNESDNNNNNNNNTSNGGQQAKFVFEIEDPNGPVDEDMKTLGDSFGRLSVIRNEESPSVSEAQSVDVDTVLAKTLQEGASKYFPHLKSCLPEELWESNSDNDLNESTDDETWMLSDDELHESDEDVLIKCHKTFFTELFTFFDYWITDHTLCMMNGRKDGPPEASVPIPQVPEIMNALMRFISIACTSLASSLHAEHVRKDITEDVAQVVRTFRMDQALPAFQSKQWAIVALIILKSLSFHAHPEYQPLTDTREAISHISTILGDANFTVEEFYAVLDLFVTNE